MSDNTIDRAHYPEAWEEFIGQNGAVRHLKIRCAAAKKRGAPLDHVLIASELSGAGKTALARLVAIALDAKIFHQSEPIKPRSVPFLMDELSDGDVLFLDEALDLDTPLPTPTGWVRLRDVREGDQLLGADGVPVHVKRLTPIKHDAVCYRVTFVDGTSLVTDAGHRWLALPRIRSGSNYLSPRVMTTQQMFEDNRPYRIPTPEPVDLPDMDLPLDPYALGQWLGNGNQGQPYINVRFDLIEDTLETIPDSNVLGWSSISNESIIRLTLGREGKEALDRLGVLNAKAMPSIYLRGSVQQRLALVQGLMDTDGHITADGYCTFANTNESIIDGMLELLRSLGYTAVKRVQRDDRVGTRGAHKPCWKVNFKGEPHLPPFRLRGVDLLTQRKHSRHKLIVSIEPVESRPVRCIEVDSDDHLFLAGDGFTVTHNCHKQLDGGKRNAEWLLTFLETGKIPTEFGLQDAPAITVIGATTDKGRFGDPFLSRFPIQPTIVPYTEGESVLIVAQLARKILEVEGLALPDAAACAAISRAASNNPREAGRILTELRDLVLEGETREDGGAYDVTEAIAFAGFTFDGLTNRDLAYLHVLSAARGRPMGRQSLKEQLGEVGNGLPYLNKRLVSRGLISLADNGAILTPAGRERAQEAA